MSYDINNFEEEVINKSFDKPVVVDFWANWCAPCRKLTPIIEKLAEEQKDRWVLAKVNTEQHQDIAMQYRVQSIPNVKMFVNGKVVSEFMGLLPESQILEWLEKALPNINEKQVQVASQLIMEGKVEEAQDKLNKIIEEDQKNDHAKVILAQTYLFSDYKKALNLVENLQADSDFYDIAESTKVFCNLFKISEEPEKLEDAKVKNDYLKAIEILKEEKFEESLEIFIDTIIRNKKYDNEGAKKACISIFKYLGEESPITKKYRYDLSSAINS